jgi:uncharacterized protein (TIGR03437 family)
MKRFGVPVHYAHGGIMRLAGSKLALASIFVGYALGQTPTVTQLENIYSWTLPGLPNYGIARGSIFAIFGANLSSATVPLQSAPLQTILSGVTVNTTVNGTTTQALLYYLSPTQINAVLPSATPSGAGTISVSTTAGASVAFPIQVVDSAFGLLTWNYGAGQVKGYDASNNYAYMGFSASTNPGDVLELWGTGLGPVSGDATLVAVNEPIEVDIGGVKAQVNYSGRSGYTGLDQINVVVPSGVSGCNVSVVVVNGSYASNFATLPVAVGSRTCSDATNPISASLLNEVSQTGSLSIGVIDLNKITTPAILGIGGGTTDTGFAGFYKITYDQLLGGATASGSGAASIGSCVVNFYNATSTSPPPSQFTFTYLNAGPDVNIVGPDGTIAMPLTIEDGFDIYVTPTADTTFIPSSGGTYTFNNGSGGPDVGAFTAQLQMAAPFAWSNMAALATVTRSNGMTVTWTGGDPTSYVSITGLSYGGLAGSHSSFVVGEFTCEAPTAAGTFTVPPAVMLSLPPSITVEGFSTSSLTVSNVTTPVTFTATGLDIGWVAASVENNITVNYQ